MREVPTRRAMVVGMAALALVAAGCRGQDQEDSGGGGDDAAAEVETDVGVTSDPCPDAVNEDNGCIYLGTISDLTVGPFAGLAPQVVGGQAAFWQRVNEDGGIGGYDIDVSTYVRDNQYSPEVHNQVYQEIKGDILAMAQSLGSQQTAAILDDLVAENIVAVPASWTSNWLFQDIILESGSNYCVDTMNAVDFALEEGELESVMAVHFPGDYGDDAAAGVSIAAEANGLEFINVSTVPGDQGAAISAVLSASPDLVVLTMSPTEAAAIVGEAVAGGFEGRFIGSAPTWNQALLDSPAIDALQASYITIGPWPGYSADTPGHEAMREYVGEPDNLNDGYTYGWVWSYALKAAIEAAVENGDLTRAGVVEAAAALESVDFEGMLPEEAGNHTGEPNDVVFRQSVINEIDPDSPVGISTVGDFFTGPTAEGYDFAAPCFEAVELG